MIQTFETDNSLVTKLEDLGIETSDAYNLVDSFAAPIPPRIHKAKVFRKEDSIHISFHTGLSVLLSEGDFDKSYKWLIEVKDK